MHLICTDFDGTIHDGNSIPPIAPELLDRLHHVQKGGVKWVINTGRELGDLVDHLRLHSIDVLPNFIVAVEREIHEFSCGEYRSDQSWNSKCQEDHTELFSQAMDCIGKIRQWIESQFDAHLYSDRWSPLCIIANHRHHADKIHRHAEAEIRSIPSMALIRNGEYFRFGHTHYNKGTTLAEIGRRLGLQKESIFAAGDHFNDLTMLDGTYAGKVAAPANAIPEVQSVVKNAGGYVASQRCSLGTLEALNYFQSNA